MIQENIMKINKRKEKDLVLRWVVGFAKSKSHK